MATQHLNRIPNSTALTTLNKKIRQVISQGNPQYALLLYRQMNQNNSLKPNNFTYPFVLKACAKLSNLHYSQVLHTHIVKSPFAYDKFVQTALVDAYLKCGQIEFAGEVFDRMPDRDLAAWNAMISGYGHMGYIDQMFCLFRDMRVSGGVKGDVVTVMGLIQGCLCRRELRVFRSVHSFGVRSGIGGDVSMGNTLVAGYAKCGDLESAKRVFNEIEFGLRTLVSWNSMIAAYGEFEKHMDAAWVYKWMLSVGFRPDVSTIVSLLSSFVESKALVQGMSVHSHVVKIGYDSEPTVVNTLVSVYCKCGKISSARFLFDCMSDRTRISWTAMISGYAGRGDMDEALALFDGMVEAGEKPDLVTLVSLISACGITGALELGRWFDHYADQKCSKESVIVCNALIDMYAKCGSIDDAREVFNAMRERTVVSWTTLISGCAMNGEFVEALETFFQMVETGVKPNYITFLVVLQACTHGGLLDKGWKCFDMMSKRYGITPGLDHYSCMADLLGRKGRINEALDFIKNMPIKPDATIWSTLLSACKIHNNIEVGEYVTQYLLELDPQVAVPYVEMANIYASSGKWDGVARIRTIMKENKIRKYPGQSLIQVNGKIHAFMVEDRGHPECETIYRFLVGLMLQAKDKFSHELEDIFYHCFS